MGQAYIVDAVRTPIGKRGGGLANVHSADLGAHVIKALMERTGVDPGAVEDVIFGCCDTVGSQAGDIARTCWLAAGLPLHVPGVTIDRQCGSSQQSVHFAALPGMLKLTAAQASQISDGASCVLVASERAVKDHGLAPRARVHHISVRADDPIYMLTAPIPAVRRALEKTGMKIDQFAAIE